MCSEKNIRKEYTKSEVFSQCKLKPQRNETAIYVFSCKNSLLWHLYPIKQPNASSKILFPCVASITS